MYHLSGVLSISDLLVKSARSMRVKGGTCMFVAVFASMLLMMPSAFAQTEAPSVEQAELIDVENQVDINTADAATLALALDGVGMAKAQDIIAYREQNGEFKTADDLQNVRGIGKATLERNRSRILIVPAEE